MSHYFPRCVIVRVTPSGCEGLAVSLRFESSLKNDFYYTIFANRDGTARVSGEELLRTFDDDRSMFLMDYEDPRSVFTGKITAQVMDDNDISRAIGALSIYSGKCNFPPGYEQNLKAAMVRSQDPSLFHLEVVTE